MIGRAATTRRAMMFGAGAVTISTLLRPAVARPTWPGGNSAAVSLTYDDGCDSQLENVSPLLDDRGLKATFFLTIENMRARQADWVALSKKGHEIGDHTMTHPCRLSGYSAEQFRREQIDPAERYLDTEFGGSTPRTFAYPCGFEGLGRGATNNRVQSYLDVLRPTFLAARTVNGLPNNPRDVLRQRYFLNGFEPTYDLDDPRPAFAYLEKAIDHGHWAIMIFHEILPARRGDGDTNIAVHRIILSHILRQPVWCAPLRTVFSHLARNS